MNRNEVIKYIVLRTIGNFLLLFALFGVGATFGPALYYEAQFRIDQARGIHYVIAETPSSTSTIPTVSQRTDLTTNSDVQLLVPKDTSFGIVIPKIGANAKIFPNVDPTNPSIFLPILQQGVAHAKGTVFPGMNGTIYLFAHSTDNFWDVGRYNAVFYLLKDLSKGDDIVVYYQGIRYDYIVDDSKIVNPDDTSYITNAQKTLHVNDPHVGSEQLILQTCWPPGTTLERLLVIAKPKRLTSLAY